MRMIKEIMLQMYQSSSLLRFLGPKTECDMRNEIVAVIFKNTNKTVLCHIMIRSFLLWIVEYYVYSELHRHGCSIPWTDRVQDVPAVLDKDGTVWYAPAAIMNFECTPDHGGNSTTCTSVYGSWTHNGWAIDIFTFSTPMAILECNGVAGNVIWGDKVRHIVSTCIKAVWYVTWDSDTLTVTLKSP